jgi:hypothetical protein
MMVRVQSHMVEKTAYVAWYAKLVHRQKDSFTLPKAAIFDLDGTLLDSVDLHALAWYEAMVKFGHDVSFEQAGSQIGKGGDKLIPVFLSADEQRDDGKELDERRGERFKSKYLPLVRPFSAVPDCCGASGTPVFGSPSLPRRSGMSWINIWTSRASRNWWMSRRLPRTPKSQSRLQTCSRSL